MCYDAMRLHTVQACLNLGHNRIRERAYIPALYTYTALSLSMWRCLLQIQA